MEPSAPSVIRTRPRSATLRHLSVYAPLAGLPLLLNPRFKVDDIPSMSQEFFSTDSIDVKFTFDFDKERAIVAAAATRKSNQQKALQEQQNRFKGAESILTPEPAPPRQEPKSVSQNRKLDLTEFENGLPPPDPWEVVRDVATELSDVLLPNRDPSSLPYSPPPAQPVRQPVNEPTFVPNPSGGRPAGGIPVFAPAPTPPVSRPAPPVSQFMGQLQSKGFSREGIQRGIAIYGEDEGKVIPFARQFDRLNQCGFEPELIAISCSVYADDNAEAVEFIENFTRLREYGFSDVQIKDALILHKNGFDQALNYILS